MIAATVDKVDMNEKINGHSITVGWLIESLRQNDKDFQKLHGHRGIKEIEASDVSVGKGFASEILRCIIKFEDSESPADVYATILKIPGFEAMKEAAAKNGDTTFLDNSENLKNLETVHECECYFYENLAPILDVPLPKVYKTLLKSSESSDGCIHMEDLTLRGRTLPLFENNNVTQMKHIVRLLAHMHKNILSINEKIWRGKYVKNETLLVNVIDMFKPMIQTFLKRCKAKELFKALYDRNQKISESKEFATYFLTEFCKTVKPVIVHGDLHSGNIMWNIDENDDAQNTVAAFVDWQTCHEGSPMSDIARALAFCCDGGTRRQLETYVVQFYYECLTKEFGGDVSKVPYTIESLQNAYNLAFVIQAFIIPVGVAFKYSILEGKDIPEHIKDCLWNEGELKALHALQDADRLLQNELKDFYEKYGV